MIFQDFPNASMLWFFMISKDPPVLVMSQCRAELTEAPGRGGGSGSALTLPAPFCGCAGLRAAVRAVQPCGPSLPAEI